MKYSLLCNKKATPELTGAADAMFNIYIAILE
jgi:hypothetical protein